jgi:hypothetical protein
MSLQSWLVLIGFALVGPVFGWLVYTDASARRKATVEQALRFERMAERQEP